MEKKKKKLEKRLEDNVKIYTSKGVLGFVLGILFTLVLSVCVLFFTYEDNKTGKEKHFYNYYLEISFVTDFRNGKRSVDLQWSP